MTLPTYATAFTDNISEIPADFLNNYVRTQIPKAVDGVGGGAYAPATQIDIGGSGLKLSNGNLLGYNSRSVVRHLALVADSASGNWSLASTPRLAWQNTASGGTLWIALEGLPHNNVLSTLSLRWIGATGHSAFPGGAPVMPSITLYRIDQDGTQTSIATVSDTSASAGAYEAAHSITLSSITHTIDRTLYRYVLEVAGETGANFISGGKALGLIATVAMTSQPEW